MARCQCLTRQGKGPQCKNDASSKPDQNPMYCWRHQNCKVQFQKGQAQAVEQVKKQPIVKKSQPIQRQQTVQKQQKVQKQQIAQKQQKSEKLKVTTKTMGTFLQKSNTMVAFDPADETPYKVTIKDVVPGQWIVDLTGHVYQSEPKGHHLDCIKVETYHSDYTTGKCEWENVGSVSTDVAMWGLFDAPAINKLKKADLEKMALDTSGSFDLFPYGIYVTTCGDGDYDVDVCRNVQGAVVAVRSIFMSED